MDDERRNELRAGLASEDARTRATVAGTVTQVDLDDLEVLRALLEVAADPTPLPDDLQPDAPADPFADFFGEAKERKLKAVGEAATERLVFTGVIGKPATVTELAVVIPDCPEWLLEGIVKVLGETKWQDRVDTVRRLVPPLHARGAALYAVLVRFGETEHRLMVGSALKPYHSRGVNELLNHAPSKPLMEEALGDGIVSGTLGLSDKDAADALTLLVSWNSPWAARAAKTLQEAYPWALLVLGMSDADAGERLATWLESGEPAPLGLVRKLQEVLKTSPNLEHFPLAAWVRYSGTGIEVVRAWKAAARCQAELETFVAAWEADGEHPDRGWDALLALTDVGLHAKVGGAAVASLARDDENETWTRARLEGVALAEPRIDGLVTAVDEAMLRFPKLSRLFVPAVMRGYPATDLRTLAEHYIALCESKPVVPKPSRPGLIHEERDGVDPVPLQQLVRALDDAALEARLQDVLPYVRSAE